MRDRSIDLSKGLAIVFVYLGHSILYHPIDMWSMYPWCAALGQFIGSFNMPMFFLISGYLFAKTKKTTFELYKGKVMRIAIPYLTTMAILVGVKLFLPTSMSYNSAAMGGYNTLISNALLYGGDRWFVYTLFIIFLFVIPFRKWLKNKWITSFLIIASAVLFYLEVMPTIFKLDAVAHFLPFFLVGMCISDYYATIKQWCLKYWIPIYIVFIVVNIVLINFLDHYFIVFRYILPFTGTIAVMTMAFQMEKVINTSKAVRYVEYLGKYSLQFYLFTFCYPIIRIAIVSVLHITNPFVILGSVFVLQLVTTTIIVEITRRIKWLKIPCGY